MTEPLGTDPFGGSHLAPVTWAQQFGVRPFRRPSLASQLGRPLWQRPSRRGARWAEALRWRPSRRSHSVWPNHSNPSAEPVHRGGASTPEPSRPDPRPAHRVPAILSHFSQTDTRWRRVMEPKSARPPWQGSRGPDYPASTQSETILAKPTMPVGQRDQSAINPPWRSPLQHCHPHDAAERRHVHRPTDDAGGVTHPTAEATGQALACPRLERRGWAWSSICFEPSTTAPGGGAVR
jgi:hypothetical protein